MKISDRYEVSDYEYKPVGIVRLIDNNGNVLFEKHNMVVNDGRTLIFKLFMNCFQFLNSNNNTEYSEPENLQMALSYDVNGSQTIPYLTYNDVVNNENKNNNNVSLSSKKNVRTKYVVNLNDRSITFNYSIKPTDNESYGLLEEYEYFKFNQIYLYYMIDNVEYLFSRVAIDPVFLAIGQEYNLEYTLYF